MAKQIKIKDEPKAPKTNNHNKLKKPLKLSAGVAVVAATFHGVFPVLLDTVEKYPEYIAGGLTIIVVIALVTVLAWCDSKA